MDDLNKDTLYRGIIFGIVLLIFIGTNFYHYQEALSWVDSFYFTIITLTTVGYGDIAPQTTVGKLFTTLYVVIGIGAFATFINASALRRTERKAKRRSNKKKEKKA